MSSDLTRHIKQIYLEDFAYVKLLDNVDFHLGYFSIGFRRQKPPAPDEPKLFFSNRPVAALNQEAIVRSLGDLESNTQRTRTAGPVALLFACLPSEIKEVALQQVSQQFTYNHCEMAFYLRPSSALGTDNINVIGVGVQADAGVFIRPRKFNEDYEWFHLACDETRMKAMLFFAFEEQGKRFDVRKMSNSVVNPGPDERSTYFCSQFIMACLEFLPHPAFHFNRCNAATIDTINSIVSCKELLHTHVSRVESTHLRSSIGSDANSRYVARPATEPVRRRV